jgi:Glycosyltransferase 61
MIHQIPFIYFDGSHKEVRYALHNNRLYPTIHYSNFIKYSDQIESRLKHDSEIDIVVNTRWHNAYFHYLEVVLCIWAIQQEYNPHVKIKNIHIGSNYSLNKTQNLQSNILDCLFPEARFADDCQVPSKPFIYIDRHLPYDKNVMLHSVFDLAQRHSKSFKEAVLSRWRIISKLKGGGPLNIVYAIRSGVKQRMLLPEVEDILLESAGSYGSVTSVDFGTLSIKDQIRISQQSDMIIGGQGSNMTNLIWLPEWGSALELRLPCTQVYDMQSMAEIFNISYLGLMGHEIIPSYYYKTGARGDNTRHFTEIDKDLLKRCFDVLTSSFNHQL